MLTGLISSSQQRQGLISLDTLRASHEHESSSWHERRVMVDGDNDHTSCGFMAVMRTTIDVGCKGYLERDGWMTYCFVLVLVRSLSPDEVAREERASHLGQQQ